MLDQKFLNELAKKLCETIPPGLMQVKGELEKNFKVILRSAFEHFDLVTHDEFDTQMAVLTKTRKKLSALEKRIKSLEEGPRKGRK